MTPLTTQVQRIFWKERMAPEDVVSSEMPEILGITNRIGVMSNGRLAGIVNTKETNQEELLRLSAKYL